MKKISIIIPVYNTKKYLDKCLNSVINQDYDNMEVIIINDGSTDGVDEKIKEYKAKYPKLITEYTKKNTGVADTRNFGIEKASGEYIMFVDSDDYIDINLLKNLKKYLKEDIDVIKFKLQRVTESGNIVEIVDGAVFEKVSGEEGFNELYKTDVLVDSPCVYIMKRKIFLKNNLRFEVNTEHEDFGLIPFIITLAKTMVSVNFYGYYYVQSDNSITRNEDYKKTLKKAYDAINHYDNAIKRIEQFNYNTVTKQNLKIFYTNAIILKTKELKKDDMDKYIKEIKKRKMIKNIKIRNLKQLIKKVLLCINIKLYLKTK